MSNAMEKTADEQGRASQWLAIGLAVFAGLARLLPNTLNLTPVGALGLFGGARLRGRLAFILPLVVMVITDGLLALLKDYPLVNATTPVVYGCFLVNVLLGRLLVRTNSPLWIGGVALLGSGAVLPGDQLHLLPDGLLRLHLRRFGRMLCQGPAVLPRHSGGRCAVHGSVLRPARAAAVPPGTAPTSGGRVVKYAAIIEYVQDKAKIAEVRPSHRQYLTGLRGNGQLAAAGPFIDDSGALIVYEADSPEEAEKLIRADPFHQNGIFVSWKLRPWNPVLVNRDLFPSG